MKQPGARVRPRPKRVLVSGAASLTVGALLCLGAALPATAMPGETASASAEFVSVSGVELGGAEFAAARAAAPGTPSDQAQFDHAAFAALTDRVALHEGSWGGVPLVYDASTGHGLLDIGQNSISGIAEASDRDPSIALSGAVGGGPDATGGGTTTVNLASAFDSLGVTPVTRHLLSQIDLQIGELSSLAAKDAYAAASSAYGIDGMTLELTSPALTGLPVLVDGSMQAASALVAEAIELVAPGGVVNLPAGTIPNIPVQSVGTVEPGAASLQVTAPNFDTVVADVMAATGGVVVSDDGLAVVDIATGEISLDLSVLFGGSLEGLAPNTVVFTEANMAAISAAVANALGKTTPMFADGVVAAIHATPIALSADIALRADTPLTPALNGNIVAAGTLTGSGSLDAFADGTSAFASNVATVPGACSGFNCIIVSGLVYSLNAAVPTVLPPLVQGVVAPLMEQLVDVEAQIIAEVDAVVAELYLDITSAFDGLMPSLASVVINEQTEPAGPGDSFTVRAVGITMLPTFHHSTLTHIGLASSAVRMVPSPTVAIAEPEVDPSGTVSISGSGWNPAGSPVALTFTDADGVTVGAPFETLVDADGSIAATWTVPEGIADAELTLTAGQDGLERVAAVTVRAAVVPPKPVDPTKPDGKTPGKTPASKSALPQTGSATLAPIGVGAALLIAAGAVLAARTLRRRV
ncbi:choice-of-anchor G family protein [Leucobacter sp. GX0328]